MNREDSHRISQMRLRHMLDLSKINGFSMGNY
jgi:hypothetical protein